jgi:hypothetical protein
VLRLAALAAGYAAGQVSDGLSPAEAQCAVRQAAEMLIEVVLELRELAPPLGPGEWRAAAAAMAGAGIPRREIARRLGITESTARKYLRPRLLTLSAQDADDRGPGDPGELGGAADAHAVSDGGADDGIAPGVGFRPVGQGPFSLLPGLGAVQLRKLCAGLQFQELLCRQLVICHAANDTAPVHRRGSERCRQGHVALVANAATTTLCLRCMRDADNQELAELVHHWGEAYRIGVQGGTWWARRRDGRNGQLTAPDPAALLAAIREDYRRDPVSRDAGPANLLAG